ncbi:4Fe-4S dicluster domain-containing protein [Caulobacter sp. S45]|uniref:4Fe-4S dicluster domain-containing protein n=1 Tax=Caulobacter sp. S45 TaxID=1641861 RepID=UPI00157668BC|nr:4Fe-4S dicluster domain-containing protein [Caulobacter sp. S45]
MSRFTLIEATGRPTAAAPAPAPRRALDRREALALMTAGVSLAMAGCGRPHEEIIPYVDQPEGLTPGISQRYATTLPLAGYGRGAMVVANDGRPTKIEGSPKHPFSLGSTDVFAEAEVLSLYDPARLQTAMEGSLPSSWNGLDAALLPRLAQHKRQGGQGLTLLTGRITSPTELRLIKALQAAYPAMSWRRFEPVDDDSVRAGAMRAFGRPLTVRPRLQDAQVVLALDADPLGPGPEQIANARAYAARRKPGEAGFSRWYVAEGGWTLTGANADHRLALRPDAIADVALALAAALDHGGAHPPLTPEAQRFVAAAAADLKADAGRAVVLVGRSQPPEVHALVHVLNAGLKAPVDAHAPVDPHPDGHMASLQATVADLRAGHVQTLIVFGGDPAYAAPAALQVAAAIAKAPFSVHFSEHVNDTSVACQWGAPLSHALESWGDLRAPDGTASLVQPLVRPLYDTRTRAQVLDALAAAAVRPSARDLVCQTWATQDGATGAPRVTNAQSSPAAGASRGPGAGATTATVGLTTPQSGRGASGLDEGDAGIDLNATAFDRFWTQALTDGIVANTAAAITAAPAARASVFQPRPASSSFLLALAPDPTLYDGARAENAWLQECPKPLTAEVWGATLAISPADARAHDLTDGDNVRLSRGGQSVVAPVRVAAGQARGVLSGFIGGGRRQGGPIGSEVGWDFAAVRDVANPWLSAVTLERAPAHGEAPHFQALHRLDGDARELSPEITLAALPGLARSPLEKAPEPPSMLPKAESWAPSWAMVIDAELCIGCNACIVACQSENNVPVVGPHEVARGRDMHWLRIDAYDVGQADEHRPAFQPVPCMQCEHAPCEPVCPVEASIHDHEGLNDQVYNRCIGTRFCQSNCPYKVRRFNYYGYSHDQAYGNMGEESVKAQHNPDVTVRARGVMEKCTYCVQRISQARRTAEKADREIGPHEVVTACQSSCPTQAISFGDLETAASGIADLRKEPRHYALLGDLGTRPRTTYLARVRNMNPALGTAAGEITS